MESANTGSPEVAAWVAGGGTIGAAPAVGAVLPNLDAILPPMEFGCRLVFIGSTAIKLMPTGSNKVFIDGINYSIQWNGVTGDNVGLVAATLYYVYVYYNGTNLLLDITTTAPALHSLYNVYSVKSGGGANSARTLVGMIYTGAGTPGIFVDSETQRFVTTYYNRVLKFCQRVLGTSRTTIADPWVEISNADRIEFITWGDEDALTFFNSSVFAAAGSISIYGSIGVNGTSIRIGATNAYTAAASAPIKISGQLGYRFSAGYNYLTLVGGSTSGSLATFPSVASAFGAMLRQ